MRASLPNDVPTSPLLEGGFAATFTLYMLLFWVILPSMSLSILSTISTQQTTKKNHENLIETFHQSIGAQNIHTVLDRPKGLSAHLLRPNTFQSPNSTFGIIVHNLPPLREGGARSKQDWFKRTPTSLLHVLHVSRNKLFGGYTSHDFVTAGARCASPTALQLSTSINR
jgi:hypothetical protein